MHGYALFMHLHAQLNPCRKRTSSHKRMYRSINSRPLEELFISNTLKAHTKESSFHPSTRTQIPHEPSEQAIELHGKVDPRSSFFLEDCPPRETKPQLAEKKDGIREKIKRIFYSNVLGRHDPVVEQFVPTFETPSSDEFERNVKFDHSIRLFEYSKKSPWATRNRLKKSTSFGSIRWNQPEPVKQQSAKPVLKKKKNTNLKEETKRLQKSDQIDVQKFMTEFNEKESTRGENEPVLESIRKNQLRRYYGLMDDEW